MRTPERKVELLDIEVIEVHDRVRDISEEGVNALAASLEKIGLRTPISVRYYQDRPHFLPGDATGDALVLMTGAHRLEAARRLGWEKVEAFVYFEGDRIDAQLWEIAENLHRAELTKLERDEQVARWIELTEKRSDDSFEAFFDSLPPDVQETDKLSQPATVSGGRGNEGGVRAAARELGLSKDDAHRAVKVAGLSDEAKTFARRHGLDDNRSALLAAAKHDTADAQVKALEERQQGGIAGRYRTPDDAPYPLPSFDDVGRALDVLLRLSPDDFNRICPPPKRAAMYQRLARLEQVFEQVREGASQ